MSQLINLVGHSATLSSRLERGSQVYAEYSACKRSSWLQHLVGHKIHLKSRAGMYTVKRVTKNKLCLTCNKWQAGTELWVDNSDFSKLAGGKYQNQITRFHEDPNITGLPW